MIEARIRTKEDSGICKFYGRIVEIKSEGTEEGMGGNKVSG